MKQKKNYIERYQIKLSTLWTTRNEQQQKKNNKRKKSKRISQAKTEPTQNIVKKNIFMFNAFSFLTNDHLFANFFRSV